MLLKTENISIILYIGGTHEWTDINADEVDSVPL